MQADADDAIHEMLPDYDGEGKMRRGRGAVVGTDENACILAIPAWMNLNAMD